MKVINGQAKAGGWLLFSVWLLVVALPAGLFSLFFERFLSFSHEQQKNRIKPLLFAEMQHFKEDLSFDSLLESDLSRFDDKYFAGRKQAGNHLLVAPNAEALKDALSRELGFPVFMVLTHGADTMRTDGVVASAEGCEVRLPTLTMLRRFFTLVNRQYAHAPVFSDTYRPAFPAGSDHEDEKTRKIYLESFLQNMLGTSMPFSVTPQKVFAAVASKIGDTGQIYIYYGSSVSDNDSGIGGGYLAVIRVSDIPESVIVRRALRNVFYPGLRRSMRLLKPSLKDPDDFFWRGLSGVVSDNERFALTTIVPERQLVRLVQKGGIVARDFSAFTGRTAGIEVSCQLSRLQHPYWQHRSLVYLAIRTLLLLSALVFMRLYLFGFNMRLSLAAKISLAVAAGGLLPLLSLILSMAVYDDLAQAARHDRIQRFIKMQSGEAQNVFAGRLKERENRLRALAEKIAAFSRRSSEDMHQQFMKWMRGSPVDAILFKPLDGESRSFISDEARVPEKVALHVEMAKIISSSVSEMLLSSPLVNPGLKSMSTLLTEGSRNVESTHSLIISNGRILNIAKLQEHARVALVIVRQPGATRLPTGVLVVIYSLEKLSEDILREASSQIAVEEEFSNWQIDRVFAAEIDGNLRKSAFAASSRLADDFVRRQMLACRNLRRDLQWHTRQGRHELFSYVHFDQTLPLASLTVVKVPVEAGVIARVDLWRWLYPLVVLALILLYSRYFFIRPACYLAHGLTTLAGGNLQQRMQLDSGDEFAALAGEFNQMAKSLMEKEQLEAYVSSDVLEEAKAAQVAHLQPGGERIAASVLFASLLPANTELVDRSAQLLQLNSFLELSQILCRENQGVIDKIVGHTLMLVFRESDVELSHQLRASLTASQLLDAVADWSSGCRVAIGLACGQLVSGKIGSRNGRLDFTVIGDTVNFSARLKSYAEDSPDSLIVVSEEMQAAIADHFVTRFEGEVQLKGKAAPVSIYRVG